MQQFSLKSRHSSFYTIILLHQKAQVNANIRYYVKNPDIFAFWENDVSRFN